MTEFTAYVKVSNRVIALQMRKQINQLMDIVVVIVSEQLVPINGSFQGYLRTMPAVILDYSA